MLLFGMLVVGGGKQGSGMTSLARSHTTRKRWARDKGMKIEISRLENSQCGWLKYSSAIRIGRVSSCHKQRAVTIRQRERRGMFFLPGSSLLPSQHLTHFQVKDLWPREAYCISETFFLPRLGFVNGSKTLDLQHWTNTRPKMPKCGAHQQPQHCPDAYDRDTPHHRPTFQPTLLNTSSILFTQQLSQCSQPSNSSPSPPPSPPHTSSISTTESPNKPLATRNSSL